MTYYFNYSRYKNDTNTKYNCNHVLLPPVLFCESNIHPLQYLYKLENYTKITTAICALFYTYIINNKLQITAACYFIALAR